MDELFSAPASVVVPRAVNQIAGAAVANPYTAAAVGIAVAGFAAVKLAEKAAPEAHAAKGVLTTVGRNLRRKLHAWTADRPVHTTIVRPAHPAAAE